MKRKITRKLNFFNKKLTVNFRKGAINKGLIPEPESIHIFSKQSIVPAGNVDASVSSSV